MSTECDACGAVWDAESSGPHSPDCPYMVRNALHDDVVRLTESLRQIADMDPNGLRADDLGRAAHIARSAIDGVAGTEQPSEENPGS